MLQGMKGKLPWLTLFSGNNILVKEKNKRKSWRKGVKIFFHPLCVCVLLKALASEDFNVDVLTVFFMQRFCCYFIFN